MHKRRKSDIVGGVAGDLVIVRIILFLSKDLFIKV